MANKTLSCLMEKYNPCPPPAIDKDQNIRMEGESPVVMLFKFLIENRRPGFFLVLSPDGCRPALRFEPGLASAKSGPEARSRWELARTAWALFVDAQAEICRLLYGGELQLPEGWHESGLHYVRISLQEITRYLKTVEMAAGDGA